MASSFRIRLKLPPNSQPAQASENEDKDSHRYASTPPASSPHMGRDSSVMDDGSSMLSGDDGVEEYDELEDSPPPQPPPQSKALKGSPVGRKLSGAAAMKAANNLKRTKLAAGEHDDPTSGGGGGGGEGGSNGSSGKRIRTASSSVATSPTHSRSSPTPPALAAARAAAIAAVGGSSRRRSLLAGLPKPIEEMSLAEIEALPAAKRRKGLKARGASGPGRGWRKGLKMDQKPVYRQPNDSPPAAVAPGTPSSFSRPKSALARDALSKASTPFRSESPYSRDSSTSDAATTGAEEQASAAAVEAAQGVVPSRTFSASHAAVAARRARAKGEDIGSTSLPSVHLRTSTPVPAPAVAPASIPAPKISVPTKEEEGRAIKAIIRGGPTVLPPPKIPIGFVTVTPLDRTGATRPARKWQRRTREVLSLGGRPWSAISWISEEQSSVAAPASSTEMKATPSNLGVTEPNTVTGTDAVAVAADNNSAVPGGGSVLSTAPASGNVTPALVSGTVTPVSGKGTNATPSLAAAQIAEGTATVTTARVPPSTIDTSAAASPQSTTPASSRTKQTLGAPASSPAAVTRPSSASASATDWKGSSAAFAAANRGRL